jgi:hypothetical protein
MPIMSRIIPAYLVFMAMGVGFNSVLGAAMIRAVLRPADDRYGFLRFGADELRQLGLGVLTLLVFIGVYMGLIMALALVSAAVGMGSGLAGAAFALGLLAVVAALAVLAVRLSLAPALTFDTGRIDLFGSWALTRGRFWPLLGTYALTLALVAMVYVLAALVAFALGAVLTGGEAPTSMSRPDMSSLKAYFTPFKLVQTVLTAGVSALVWPVMFTPPTAIYRGLSPAGGAADVFV